MIRTEVIPFGAWGRDPWVAYTNGSLGERSVLAIPPIGADESSPRVVVKGVRTTRITARICDHVHRLTPRYKSGSFGTPS